MHCELNWGRDPQWGTIVVASEGNRINEHRPNPMKNYILHALRWWWCFPKTENHWRKMKKREQKWVDLRAKAKCRGFINVSSFLAVSFMSVWCFFFFLYIYIYIFFNQSHPLGLSTYTYCCLQRLAWLSICIKRLSWDFNPPLCFSDFLSVFFVTLHALCHQSKVV